MKDRHIVFTDKEGNIVPYSLRDFREKPLWEIAKDLGYENTLEFGMAQIPLILAGLILNIISDIVRFINEAIIEEERFYEECSNYWGE